MEKLWRYCHPCQKALWVPEDNRLQPACPECGSDTVAAFTRPPNAPVKEIKESLGMDD